MDENQFFTLEEIASLALKAPDADRTNLPRTLRGWKGHATRRGWNKRGDKLMKIKNGVRAYHASLLPRTLKVLVPPTCPDVPARPDMAKIITQGDKNRANARKAILDAISNYMRKNNLSQKAAILAFVEDVQAAHVKSAKINRELLRLTEFDLDYSIVATARNWNLRKGKWTVSRSTIYEWKAEIEGPRKPRPKKSATDVWGFSHVEKEVFKANQVITDMPDEALQWIVLGQEKRIIRILEERGYRITWDSD